MYSKGKFYTGIIITLIAGILFFASLFLPWFNPGYYSMFFEMPFEQAASGQVTDLTLVAEPMSQFQGHQYIDFYIGKYSITLYVVTVITAALCLLLCILLLKITRKALLSKFALAQLSCSILGIIPFFFIPKELKMYRLILENQLQDYPSLGMLTSSISYGIILAIIGAGGLILGALITWLEIRKKEDDEISPLPMMEVEQ